MQPLQYHFATPNLRQILLACSYLESDRMSKPLVTTEEEVKRLNLVPCLEYLLGGLKDETLPGRLAYFGRLLRAVVSSNLMEPSIFSRTVFGVGANALGAMERYMRTDLRTDPRLTVAQKKSVALGMLDNLAMLQLNNKILLFTLRSHLAEIDVLFPPPPPPPAQNDDDTIDYMDLDDDDDDGNAEVEDLS
jgi:hypothetical protein